MNELNYLCDQSPHKLMSEKPSQTHTEVFFNNPLGIFQFNQVDNQDPPPHQCV
jgi:hypothetical protein